MRSTAVLFIALVLAGFPVLTSPLFAEGRAFEIADYYATVVPSAPSISPSGQSLAISVQHRDLAATESWQDLWFLKTDGSDAKRLTHARYDHSSPTFSPDGARLLFVSDRSGSSQLWSMPLDGGEPVQLTDFPAGVWDPVFSPDGRTLAVTTEVYPECGADGECHQKISKKVEGAKLSVHVADQLLYRHWASWRDGRYPHVLLVDADTGEVLRDLTPGTWDTPTFSLGGARGYTFAPDGKGLVVVSNRDPDQASSTNADLWWIDLEDESAEPRNLTAANRGWDGAPLFSPDGGSVAFLSQETPAYEADFYRLRIWNRRSGEIRTLVGRDRFDNWIDEIAWSGDGASIFFQAEVHGRTPLHRVAVDTGEITHLLTDGNIDGWSLAEGGKSFVYARRTVGEPTEIFRAPTNGGEPIRLTTFNEALENEVDIRPAEELWVDGAGDYKVHVFLVKPHDFDPVKKYPLILNVHGGPQSQWADAYRGDWQVYPGKGYVVAFPNPTGSAGYGQEFTDAIGCDWGGRVYEDLMKVTDALAELPFVDENRMGAMGWSYGGYMMMWFQGHTDRFAAQAAMMGLYDLPSFYGATEELWFPETDLCGTPWDSEEYTRWSPSRFVDHFSTPSLVITGERDYRVPYTQSLQYFTALQKKKIPSRLVVFPNAGHWPAWYEMAFYYNAHLDWFHRYLGGVPPAWDVIDHARGGGPIVGKGQDGD